MSRHHGYVCTTPDSLSERHEKYSCLVWTETAQNWNKAFTLCRIALAPAGKPYRIGRLFTSITLISAQFLCRSDAMPLGCSFTLRRRVSWKPIWYMTIHFQDRTSAPSLRLKICAEISVLCVNKRPIRYGFRASARAIRYSVDIAYDEDSLFQS